MDTHKSASLTPKGRETMVCSVIKGGPSKAAAARRFNITPKTVAKRGERFRDEGEAGLEDRSSKPRSSPSQSARRLRGGRDFAKTAPHRRTDRRRGWRFGRHGQPHPETAWPQSLIGARAGRAHMLLRIGSPWRDLPRRHQKAGQVQPDRPWGYG
jgi:transposase-like protein